MVGLTIIQGDTIRAYDFKPMVGRGDCFVEGEVIDAHNTEQYFQAYKIRVTKDVFGGEEQSKGKQSRVGQIVFVPWRVDFQEYQGRVINLSR